MLLCLTIERLIIHGVSNCYCVLTIETLIIHGVSKCYCVLTIETLIIKIRITINESIEYIDCGHLSLFKRYTCVSTARSHRYVSMDVSHK